MPGEGGRAGEARRRSAEAVAVASRSIDAWHKRAAVLAITGRPDEALAAVQQAVSLGASRNILHEDEDLEPLLRWEAVRRSPGLAGSSNLAPPHP